MFVLIVLARLIALPVSAADFDGVRPAAAAWEAPRVVPESRELPRAEDTRSAGLRRYDSDCVRFIFHPQDRESEVVWLRSQEWEEVCQHDPQRGRTCQDRAGFIHREKVWISIAERQPLLPWEKEAFRVCLEGPRLSFDTLREAYDYHVKGVRERGGVRILLKPGAKKALDPDADGLTLAAFDASLRFAAADKWAAYYQGEKTVLRLTLKERGLFGSTLLEKTLEFDPADRYDVDLRRYAAEFRKPAKPGKEYYLKWTFQRVGRTSTDRSIKKDDSGYVVYSPSSAGF